MKKQQLQGFQKPWSCPTNIIYLIQRINFYKLLFRPATFMLQPPLLPDMVYHVYTHANGFENLFNSEENFQYFLKKYAEYILPIAETYAYCLMPNHIHFMIKVRSENEVLEYLILKKLNKLKEAGFQEESVDVQEHFQGFQNLKESIDEKQTLQGFKTLEESVDKKLYLQGFENLGGISTNISQQFSNLFNAYTKAFNKMYNRKGSLFIPNFKRKEINNETHMSQVMAYIHNNPVHHGFIKQAIDWPYSSFQAYVSEKSTNLNREFMYSNFESKEQFIAFHKNNSVPYKLVFDE